MVSVPPCFRIVPRDFRLFDKHRDAEFTEEHYFTFADMDCPNLF
jgi:hypothetical protein